MEETDHQQKNSKDVIKKGVDQFARYSTLAFEMGGVIFVSVWGGKKLDALCGFEKPTFLIALSLFGVFCAIYVAIKDLIKTNK